MDKPRQEKSRKQLPVVRGGGGIEGLVFWGGALAVAGLVAAFTFRKRRKTDKSITNGDLTPIDLLNEYGMKVMENPNVKELQSAIPNQTPKQNTSIPDTDGEIENYASNHHQENLVSDTEQESITVSEDYNCVAEESPSPMAMSFPGNPDSSSENTSKNRREDSGSESLMESSFSSSSTTETDDDENEDDSSIQSSISSSTEEEDENLATQSPTKDNDEEKSEESSTEMVEADQAVSSESKPTDLCRQIYGDRTGNNGSEENVRMMMMKSKNENEVSCCQRLLGKMTRKILVNSILVIMMLSLLTNILLSFYLPDASSLIQ